MDNVTFVKIETHAAGAGFSVTSTPKADAEKQVKEFEPSCSC